MEWLHGKRDRDVGGEGGAHRAILVQRQIDGMFHLARPQVASGGLHQQVNTLEGPGRIGRLLTGHADRQLLQLRPLFAQDLDEVDRYAGGQRDQECVGWLYSDITWWRQNNAMAGA